MLVLLGLRLEFAALWFCSRTCYQVVLARRLLNPSCPLPQLHLSAPHGAGA